jgi:DnaJ-domain-containing protein 1
VVAGAVIDGPFAGRDLSDLSTVEMAELLHLCRREDPSSAQVLEAYLDRCRPGWRKDDQGSWGEEDAVGAPADPGVMTRAEALRILGLAEGATEDEIRRAYHHLIASLHPDLGGSAFLAAQVNRARDVLLGR